MLFMTVLFSVKDFAVWRASFDSRQDVYVKNGMLVRQVHQSIDDPTSVMCYFECTSVECAQHLLTSTLLAELKECGVVTKPAFTFYVPVGEAHPAPPFGKACLTMEHTVANFDKWYAVFLQHEQGRQAAGIQVLQLHQVAGNPHSIMALCAVNNVDSARQMFLSREFSVVSVAVTSPLKNSYYRLDASSPPAEAVEGQNHNGTSAH
jgi:hypothetical protein